MNKDTIREKMQTYLRKMEEARQKELERAQQRTQILAQFQELVKSVIKPAMENFSKEMESDACRFRIDGEYTDAEDPQIRYWMTPTGVNLNDYEFKDVPHLFYGVDTDSNFVITHISTVVKGCAGRIYEGPRYQLEEMTADVIEKDLVKVLGELLDNLLS
ncbi:MAG: hypothetical protein ACOY3I_07935 [Verrucomicrobiota bacterium]